MKPSGSLPRLQKPGTCPYNKPDRSSSCHAIPFSLFIKIPLDIFLPTTTRFSNWSLSLILPHQKAVCTSACHLPCPSVCSWFHYSGNYNIATDFKITTESHYMWLPTVQTAIRSCILAWMSVRVGLWQWTLSVIETENVAPKCVALVIHRVLLFWIWPTVYTGRFVKY